MSTILGDAGATDDLPPGALGGVQAGVVSCITSPASSSSSLSNSSIGPVLAAGLLLLPGAPEGASSASSPAALMRSQSSLSPSGVSAEAAVYA